MNAADPVAGDSAGDVSIAVFFDYACGYCRSTLPGLKTLIESDPRVRIVYKEFPILGPNSRTAALAALAAGRQGKYIEFHHKLLSSRDLSDQGIKAIAMELGLDHAQLMRDMADPVFAGLITTNAALANELDINVFRHTLSMTRSFLEPSMLLSREIIENTELKPKRAWLQGRNSGSGLPATPMNR